MQSNSLDHRQPINFREIHRNHFTETSSKWTILFVRALIYKCVDTNGRSREISGQRRKLLTQSLLRPL